MKIYYEYNGIESFKAWSGGLDTQRDIINADKCAEFDNLVEDIFSDGCTETELNDFLWFDRENIYDMLGLDENGELITEDAEQCN